MNTTQTRKGYFSHPERQVMLAAFSAKRLPGDRPMLSDEVMQAALEGRERLQAAQWQALLGSPLTLCRLRYLEGRRLAASADGAANNGPLNEADHEWRSSRCELLAASGTGNDVSLYSPDGLWALHALTTGSVTRLLLQLLPPAEDGAAGATARPTPGEEVAVLDGAGSTLMMGRLDTDGELEAVWTLQLDLRSHLAHHGRTWSVVRA
jgi:hypothetical protein